MLRRLTLAAAWLRFFYSPARRYRSCSAGEAWRRAWRYARLDMPAPQVAPRHVRPF